jgi:hypothetical protein
MIRYLWVLIVTELISLGLSGNIWAANWNNSKSNSGTKVSDVINIFTPNTVWQEFNNTNIQKRHA